jgi:hypothetical protein
MIKISYEFILNLMALPRQMGAMLTLETDRIFSTNLSATSLG